MVAFAIVRDFLEQQLTQRGYDPLPFVSPGPGTSDDVLDAVPGQLVALTHASGGPFTNELLFDQPFFQATSVGPQNDYDGAEQLAYDVDRSFCQVDTPRNIGGLRVLYIARVGGAPSLLRQDQAQRSHFVATYRWHVESGLD